MAIFLKASLYPMLSRKTEYLTLISHANDKNIPEGIVIFSFLTSQQKGKRNAKLCELCVSVVKEEDSAISVVSARD